MPPAKFLKEQALNNIYWSLFIKFKSIREVNMFKAMTKDWFYEYKMYQQKGNLKCKINYCNEVIKNKMRK